MRDAKMLDMLVECFCKSGRGKNPTCPRCQIEERLDELKDALDFYANRENYKKKPHSFSEIEVDLGERARDVLGYV